METREDFCGACVAGVTALVGSGTAVATKGNHSKNKRKKKIIFWGSVGVTVVAIFATIYFLWIKQCNECA